MNVQYIKIMKILPCTVPGGTIKTSSHRISGSMPGGSQQDSNTDASTNHGGVGSQHASSCHVILDIKCELFPSSFHACNLTPPFQVHRSQALVGWHLGLCGPGKHCGSLLEI